MFIYCLFRLTKFLWHVLSCFPVNSLYLTRQFLVTKTKVNTFWLSIYDLRFSDSFISLINFKNRRGKIVAFTLSQVKSNVSVYFAAKKQFFNFYENRMTFPRYSVRLYTVSIDNNHDRQKLKWKIYQSRYWFVCYVPINSVYLISFSLSIRYSVRKLINNEY